MHSLNSTFNDQRQADMRTAAAERRLGLELHRSPTSRRGGLARLTGRLIGTGGPTVAGEETLSIRRLDPGGADREALARVAGRDSRAVPAGDVIGAELGGRLIAALSLSTGETVADPFEPSDAARTMLDERAARIAAASASTSEGSGAASRLRHS